MLRVIARIKEEYPLAVRSTFLGAHAVGRAYEGRQEEYVDYVQTVSGIEYASSSGGYLRIAQTVDFVDEFLFTVSGKHQMGV